MPVMYDSQAASDTLTLLLANAMHRNEPIKARAAQVKRTAKLIQQRTKDNSLKNACRSLRNAATDGLVIQAIELAEHNYFHKRG